MALRWKVLALVFLARSGLGVQFQTLNSLSGELQEGLGINFQQFGLLVGLFMIAGVFLSFPAGLLSRWLSDRTIIACGLLLLSIGGLLGTLNESYPLIATGRIISGAGFVLGTLYFAKVISDWFAGKELATAMGILVMSWPIGIAVAQVTVPWMAETFSWQAAFYASSAWCVAGAIGIALVLPSKVKQPVSGSNATIAQNQFSASNWALTIIAGIAWGSFNAGFVVYLSFIDTRFAELAFNPVKSSLYASLPSWIMPISAILAGQWVDRSNARYLAIFIASGAGVVAMLMLAYTQWAFASVLIFGIVGASAAGVIMSLTMFAMPVEARALGMGVFFTVYFLCVLPAPAIAGWLADQNGQTSSALAFAALLFLLTGLSAIAFRWLHQRWIT